MEWRTQRRWREARTMALMQRSLVVLLRPLVALLVVPSGLCTCRAEWDMRWLDTGTVCSSRDNPAVRSMLPTPVDRRRRMQLTTHLWRLERAMSHSVQRSAGWWIVVGRRCWRTR